MLERDRERAALDAVIADVRAGTGRTVVIEGHPGMGKSTVVAAASVALRRDDPRVLSFCCGELEQELPWAGIVGLLGPAIAELSDEDRAALLSGPSAAAKSVFGGAAALPANAADGVTHALYRVIADLAARRPLLLVLDDAHWCDRPTLQLLAYLQRRLALIAAGLVVATRPPGLSSEQRLLERLLTGADTTVHRLRALGPASVAELVRAAGFPGADADFCATCGEVTAGNPFYLQELLIELRERGIDAGSPLDELSEVTPPAVLRALLVRLDRLDAPGAGELAAAVTVLGDGATIRQAAALAGLDPAAAVAALDALAAAELLAPGEPLRFVHPLVRTAIYSDIPAARRSQQHGRAAQRLTAEHAAPEVVAMHLLLAPRRADPDTVAQLRAAAARDRARGAPAEAARHLRRALEEPPAPEQRAELLVELAQAETAAGDGDAVAHLEQALTETGDPRRRAEILHELGWSEHHAGRFPAAAAAFERGMAIILPEPDPELAAQLETGYLVAATLDSDRVADANARIRAIEAGPTEIQSSAHRMLLSQVLFMRTMSAAPHEGIIELAERIWAGGQLLVDEGAESHTLWHVVGALSWADAYDRALDVIERTLMVADRRGLALAHAQARYARAWPHYWTGHLAEAQADAQAAVAIWYGGMETYLPGAVYWLGLSSLALGEPERAERALAFCEPLDRWEGTGMLAFVRALEGHLHLHHGRVAAALDCHRRAGEVMGSLMITNPSTMPWRSEASRALRLLGDDRQARALAQEELEIARRSGGPRPIGVALVALGTATGGETGIRHLRRAAAILGSCGARLEQARADLELGSAIRRAGRRRAARPHLHAALELAQSAGAVVLARSAETELRAAGARGRRATDTGPGLLTASERRVAELAAADQSNRLIAGTLQISVKAVEWHLHQSYRKLDIRGRGQLAEALATDVALPAAARE